MRMENGHLLQMKMGTCRRKWGTSPKKGALIRVEKGKGHVYKLIGALVKVKGALFLCKKGHFSYVKRGTLPMQKGALFGCLKKWGGGGHCAPLAPPPPGRTASAYLYFLSTNTCIHLW